MKKHFNYTSNFLSKEQNFELELRILQRKKRIFHSMLIVFQNFVMYHYVQRLQRSCLSINPDDFVDSD